LSTDRPPFAAPEAPDLGPEFGRYVVKSLLGEGSMAQVYRAYDPLAERDVALKVLRVDAGRLQGKGGRVRFFREAEAAGRLSHPHIVTIYDVTDDYIVMEYLDGVTLEYLLSWRAPLPVEEAMAILHPLADALDYAHARGIIHRDVKPGNIIVLPDGAPRLTDFGVAHLDSASITSPGEFLGSPSYMSPEQIDGHAVSPRSDVFSLAAVAYEMLTGSRAFAGPSVPAALHAVLHGSPTLPTRLRPELPAHFDETLARALAKRADDRYATAGEFAAALDGAGYTRALERLAKGESSPGSPRPALPGVELRPVAASVSARTRGFAETRDLGLLHKISGRKPGSPSAPLRVRAGLKHWLAVMAVGTVIAMVTSVARDPMGAFGREKPIGPPIITVDTQPSGASVWLDERPLGSSPIVGAPLGTGTHILTLDRPGFAPVRVRFESRAAASFRFTLRPQSTLEARPFGATVSVVRPGEQIEAVERVAVEPQSLAVRASAPAHVVWPPRRMSGDRPTYPAAAVADRLQGTVVADLTVTRAGKVADITIIESAGDVLDQAVIDSVRSWRFDPATQAGAPVAVRWQVRQRFDIR
jgi:eukaryotic-like serine/threonine-protein kinase